MKGEFVGDIAYGDCEECLLDVVYPFERVRDATVLYFHGGGMQGGSKTDDEYVARSIASLGVCVLNANYRLYPHCSYPDFVQDAAQAVRWFFDNREQYALGHSLIVAGCSAGAHLAMSLCFCDRFLGEVGVALDSVAGFYFDSGQPTTHFRVLKEFGIDERLAIIDDKAPMFYVNDKHYPPMTIITYTDDLPARLEQNKLLYTVLKRFNPNNNIAFHVLNGTHASGNRLAKNTRQIRHLPYIARLMDSCCKH